MPTPSGGTPWTLSTPSTDYKVASLLSDTKWSSNTLTYSFPSSSSYFATSYAENNAYFRPLSTSQQAAVKVALQSWSNVSGLQFTQSVDNQSIVGDIRFGFSAIDATSGSQAWAYLPYGSPQSGDVWFNTQGTSFTKPWSLGTYENMALIHEIGHAVGLKHSFEASYYFENPPMPSELDTRNLTVMSYSARAADPGTAFSYEPTTPMVLDIDAIQYLYGANTTFNASNTTYTFSEGQTYHQTIWDAGGNDTIVYSASTGGTIDLRPGMVGGCKLGQAVYVKASGVTVSEVENNIWIASNAVIENATGGSGNDTLIGNTVANVLIGGKGSDNITGGGGNDTIDCGDGQVDFVNYDNPIDQYKLSLSGGTYTVRALSGSEGTDTVKGVEYFRFGNQVYYYKDLDLDAPTVLSFSPPDDGFGVSVNSTIKVTFSEFIKMGTGSIVLKDAANNVVDTYNVATSTQLSISGATLTINPSRMLNYGTRYLVTFESGTVQDLSGNAYAGTTSYDFTTGYFGAQTYTGTSGADTWTGGTGNDTLIGLGGTDVLNGGEGSDTYIVNRASEHAAAEFNDTGTSGTDEVRFTSTTAETLKMFAGDRGIEKIVIGTGMATSAVTTGTTANSVDASKLTNGVTLIGNNGANTLTGTKFSDILEGNLGADILLGGAGNDTYIVDLLSSGSVQATVTESGTSATEVDTIRLRGSYSLGTLSDVAAAITLAANVENLDAASVVAGTGMLNLVGNNLANTITGSSGRDLITGGAGVDVLLGGKGNDRFVIAAAADHTTAEVIHGGDDFDEIRYTSTAAGTLTLSAGVTSVEYVSVITSTLDASVTTNTAAIHVNAAAVGNGMTIMGNGGSNVITGTNYSDSLLGAGGNDRLIGGPGLDNLNGGTGNDTLTGGEGLDSFIFNSALNSFVNNDTITDFVSGADKIVLENDIFKGLVLETGVLFRRLSFDEFRSGAGVTTAFDATDRIMYNTSTGAVYYDADGTGASQPFQFASLTGRVPVAYTDFQVI